MKMNSEVMMRNAHRFEAVLLVYMLVLVIAWCGVRLATAGLPMDTGWSKSDRDPRTVRTTRPFRAISPPSITASIDECGIQQ